MKNSFLLPLVIVSVFTPVPGLAADEIQWGEAVNGLRLGVQSATITATADQTVTFKIIAQNVSSQSIFLPTPQTFVSKSNPDSDDYHASPLTPVIVPNPGRYSYGSSGVSLDKSPETVVILVPGQSVTWDAIPLEEHDYVGDRLPPGNQTTVKHWILVAGDKLHIRFQYDNEQKRVAGKAVWVGRAESGATDLAINPPSTEGIQLESKFSLPKLTYFLGEPIVMTFTVTNKGDGAIEFLAGGDYRGSGRHDRFSIRAVDEQGGAVEDPVPPSGFGGGLGGSIQVKPGESHTETMLVNHWCAFSKPGKYTITCKRTLNVCRSDRRKPSLYSSPESSLPAIPVETTFIVELADDPAALNAYLGTFVPTLLMANADDHLPPWKRKGVPTGNRWEELECLALDKNEAALPVLMQLLETPDFQASSVGWLSLYGPAKVAPLFLARFSTWTPNERENALGALNGWKTPGIEPLIAASLRDKDWELRLYALGLCINQRYDTCTPILLTMGDDPNRDLRYYRAEALGTCGDRKAIPILLKLLHDPDLETQMCAADALGKFKRQEGVPVLIDRLRDHQARESGYDLRGTLGRITGQNPGSKYTDWLAWWDRTGRAEYEKH